jgi:hypothetical protein
MITSVRVLPTSERTDVYHSFIQMPGGASIFSGWGPRL